MPEIKLYLLDSPHIEIDHSPVKFQSRKETALLAYLALANKACRRETLVALLWPDYDAPRGRVNLRQRVFGLNKILPEGWLISDQETM